MRPVLWRPPVKKTVACPYQRKALKLFRTLREVPQSEPFNCPEYDKRKAKSEERP